MADGSEMPLQGGVTLDKPKRILALFSHGQFGTGQEKDPTLDSDKRTPGSDKDAVEDFLAMAALDDGDDVLRD